MAPKEEFTRLDDAEARRFCALVASKHFYDDAIPHVHGTAESDDIYGKTTYEWLREFFVRNPYPVYIIEDPSEFSVIRFPTGRWIDAYIREREWRGYEYLIADENADYVWGIWHEHSIYAYGTAVAWLRQRTWKLFELLGVSEESTVMLSDLRFSGWGKNIEIVAEVLKDRGEVQPFTLSFQECAQIRWEPLWKDTPAKLKLWQTYFGTYLWTFETDMPFFAIKSDSFELSFEYKEFKLAMSTAI